MVAAPTIWASGTPSCTASGTGAWATLANASGTNNGSWCTFTSATSAEVGTVLCTGYGVTYGAQEMLGMECPYSIDSIDVTIYSWYTTVSRWTSAGSMAQLYDGATPLGSTKTFTRVATPTTNSQTLNFLAVASYDNLANIGVNLTCTKSGTTSDVWWLDAVSMVVNYTPSPVVGNTFGEGSPLYMIG